MTYNIEYVKSEELNKGEYQVILYTNNYEIGEANLLSNNYFLNQNIRFATHLR